MNDLEMKAHFIALEWMKDEMSRPVTIPNTPETYARTYENAYERILKVLSHPSNTSDHPYPIHR